MANLDLINPMVMDFNNDGVVDQADVDYAAQHINAATALMVNRYVNPPEVEYHYAPGGEIDTDVPPWSQHWLNFDASPGNSFSLADTIAAQNAGVPIEIMWHVFEVVAQPLPDSIKQSQFELWEQQALSGENPNLSWYPIQEHNPKLPYSSVAPDETIPPGSNPSSEEPAVPFDEFHPLDFNQDGFVNVLDVQYAAQTYGEVVAHMVVRHWQGGMTYDINGDGIVDVSDLIAAITANCPQPIINAIQLQVMNPPPAEQEYDSTAPTAEDGSGYHPLDGNQDGIVDVLDIVYWAGRDDLSQIAKTLITGMCERYMDGICPYDVNQDGTINVLDINYCSQNGIPENILHDMVANVGTEVPLPEIPEVVPPVVPGPTIVTNNLWMPQGNWGLINGTPYYGPVHKHSNNLGRMYMTEYSHKNHSRVLIPLVANPEEALTELPDGQVVPIELNESQPTNNMFSGLGDLNGDGMVNVLDQIMQNNQNFLNNPNSQNNDIGFTSGLTDTNGDGVVDILDQIALINEQNNNGGGNTGGGNNNNNNSGGNMGGGSGGGGGGAY